MRKIYSLVLMAAALLIGTNAWAQASVRVAYNSNTAAYAQNPRDFSGASALQDAIKSILPGDTATITLLADQKLKAPVVIPLVEGDTTAANSTNPSIRARLGQRICLDMNGFNIEDDPDNNTTIGCIHLVKGMLHITGVGELKHNKAGGTSNWNKSVITVAGAPWTYKQTNWTTLIIDERVFVNSLGAGQNYGVCIQNSSNMPSNISSKAGYSTYETNVTAADPINCVPKTNAGCAYGVKVYIKGRIFGHHRGINVVGTINAAPECDENWNSKGRRYSTWTNEHPFYYNNFYPYLKIFSTAQVWCYDNGLGSGNGGIYAGGYCVWDISGYVHGQTGIFMKSGDLQLTDATVASDADVAQNGANYGETVSGTGIFIASDAGYAGEVEVKIEGDSKVSGGGGSAITDAIATNNNGETNVSHIEITGGTIEPGDQGAITITTSTKDSVELTGGNIESATITVGGETVNTSSIVPTGGDYHTTTVSDPETGKEIVIVSTGAAPTGDANVAEGHDANSSVKWTGATETISADLTLKELEINESTAQTLTIAAGKSLTVGRLVLGSKAQIIVEPTARLIVNGTQGIVAPVVTNLILQANNTTQGTLLFNPAVSSNRQPYATVQFTTNAHQINATPEYKWQRLTSPLAEISAIAYSSSSVVGTWGGAFATSISKWDYVNNAWSAPLASITQLKAFEGYALTNNATNEGVRYNFKGRIQGTVSDDLVFQKNGWNFFGNAYTASMDIMTLIDSLHNDKVAQTIYVWDQNDQMYIPVNATILAVPNHDEPDTIPALQTVIFYLDNAEATEMSAKMDYNTAVWEFGTKTGTFAPAPARQRSMSDFSSVRINVTSEEGMTDRVVIIENDLYSDEYENGADAYKFMNENHINFYAVSDNDQAIVATNNMVGTILSLQTMDEVSYTMSFDKVNGEVYALRDNLTNTVVLMNEGATYNFMAQSNATLDGRFQVVSRQEMPTAVETVEETVAPKAIYTVMGQYVGETTDWNNLPAGVYVVDGVKIVK